MNTLRSRLKEKICDEFRLNFRLTNLEAKGIYQKLDGIEFKQPKYLYDDLAVNELVEKLSRDLGAEILDYYLSLTDKQYSKLINECRNRTYRL